MLKSNEDHRTSLIVRPLKFEHVQCIIDNHTTEILSDLHCLIVYQYFKWSFSMCQGLESLISTPSTQLSLVSEGAECILISKRLFLKEANVKVLRIVTDLVGVHRGTPRCNTNAVLCTGSVCFIDERSHKCLILGFLMKDNRNFYRCV